MTNHVHLVFRPTTEDGLQRVLKPLHMRYAQRINKVKGCKGHLWQGRFFSPALDEAYAWSAIRYVERKPVSAGMVTQVEKYPWSSAAARCGLINNVNLAPHANLGIDIAIKQWSDWLAVPESPDVMKALSMNTKKCLPCGSDTVIAQLEKQADRILRFRPQGRPIKG